MTSFSVLRGGFNAWEGAGTPDRALKWLTDIIVLTNADCRLFLAVALRIENGGWENEAVCHERANPSYYIFLQPPKCQSMGRRLYFMNGRALHCVGLLHYWTCWLIVKVTIFVEQNPLLPEPWQRDEVHNNYHTKWPTEQNMYPVLLNMPNVKTIESSPKIQNKKTAVNPNSIYSRGRVRPFTQY